jgi:hypothetical protein
MIAGAAVAAAVAAAVEQQAMAEHRRQYEAYRAEGIKSLARLRDSLATPAARHRLNCVNCGAPAEPDGAACSYCGTAT